MTTKHCQHFSYHAWENIFAGLGGIDVGLKGPKASQARDNAAIEITNRCLSRREETPLASPSGPVRQQDGDVNDDRENQRCCVAIERRHVRAAGSHRRTYLPPAQTRAEYDTVVSEIRNEKLQSPQSIIRALTTLA